MSATLKPVRAMDPQPSCCTGGRTTSTATSTRRRCWRPGAGSTDGQYHRGALAGALQGARVGERISAGPCGWGWRRDGPTHVLVLIPTSRPEPFGNVLESLTTLSYLAASTNHIQLGT